MRWTAFVLCAATAAAMIGFACTESDSTLNEPSAYFGRDPNAQATIRAQHRADTTPRIDLPSQGHLHATGVVNDVRDGYTRTESRFWFEDGVVTHAEYEIYDAVTDKLLETQTTNGNTTRSSDGWTLPTEPDHVIDLLPALSATFLVEVAEMTEVQAGTSGRVFECRASWDRDLLQLIEIEPETNVVVREYRTRNGELVTERLLSYEILTGNDIPAPRR